MVPDLSPNRKIGSYYLIERLGSGALGEVWKARDQRLERIVALKFLTTRTDDSGGELVREARAASRLNHPNIITVFDLGKADGDEYIAMEFVDGETLRACLNRPPVPLEAALDIARQMAKGLAIAHRHGIIHRDLKPENIMVRVDGMVKLVDFGLAKRLPWGTGMSNVSTWDGSQNETGQVAGTFAYMAPEQARGLPVTPASDVFSFGIILYELLGGQHPFRETNVADTLNGILSKEPRGLAQVRPGIPPGISRIVHLCLRKAAADRPADAGAVVELLETIPAAVIPRAPVGRQRKLGIFSAVTALLMLLLMIGGYLWFRQPVMNENIQSVAVVTLKTEGADAAALGSPEELAEDLGGALAKSGLKVASRNSVLAVSATRDLPLLRQRLGVDAVVEGTIRSIGNGVRIHVELVSTKTSFQIWSGNFIINADQLLGNDPQGIATDIVNEIHQALVSK